MDTYLEDCDFAGRGLVRTAASIRPSPAAVVSPAFRCSSDYAGTDSGEFSAPADSYMQEPQVKRSLSSIS